MNKRYPIIAVACLILLASCQGFSVGIAKKANCCDDILNKCTNVKSVVNGTGTAEKTSASGSEDLLKDLPFSTLVQ